MKKIFLYSIKGAHPYSSLWTFPSIITAAMLIAWAAEAAQFLISQGLALAILAWLQTLPEFAVEASIAWNRDIPNMTANLTGSLRLLVGLGWPLIYFVAFFSHLKKYKKPLLFIKLENEHSVETLFLLPPLIYFIYIYFKGTLTIFDGSILIFIYLIYLYVLNKIPPQEEEKLEDVEAIPRRILSLKKRWRNTAIIALFLSGGLILLFTVEKFVESLKSLALFMGISEFVFIQWMAPFLSEFPEKVSAINWARRIKTAPIAIMNFVSSNINQWTVLAGSLPFVFSISSKGIVSIPFDSFHRLEIILTVAQSFLGFIFLINMRFHWYEATALFTLWFIQFIFPSLREEIFFIYLFWIGIELMMIIFKTRSIKAFKIFFQISKENNIFNLNLKK
ncbi:MAG: hypothetical protein AB1410_11285 [Acidobacteriota bacterium]